jgi:hypothetical protein
LLVAVSLQFFILKICPGCPDIDPPENGYAVSTFSGAVKKFFCNPGSVLSGSQTDVSAGYSALYCDGFHWNGTVALCNLIEAIDTTELVEQVVVQFDIFD